MNVLINNSIFDIDEQEYNIKVIRNESEDWAHKAFEYEQMFAANKVADMDEIYKEWAEEYTNHMQSDLTWTFAKTKCFNFETSGLDKYFDESDICNREINIIAQGFEDYFADKYYPFLEDEQVIENIKDNIEVKKEKGCYWAQSQFSPYGSNDSADVSVFKRIKIDAYDYDQMNVEDDEKETETYKHYADACAKILYDLL